MVAVIIVMVVMVLMVVVEATVTGRVQPRDTVGE